MISITKRRLGGLASATLTTRRVVLLTATAVLVGACSSAGGAANTAESALPTAQLAESTSSPVPAVAASITPEPTETPEEPVAEANVQVESTTFLYRPAEYTKGETDAVLIIKLANKGAAPAHIDGSGSDYTIYAADGESVLQTGDFLYTYPEYLAPGESGYLAQDVRISEPAKKVKGAQVEFEPAWETVDETDVTTYSVAKVKNKWDRSSGMSTKGTIKVNGDEAINSGWVGAIYLDANDKPLGYSYTNLIENLKPGKPKGFSTVGFSQFPTSKTKAQVKETVVFGGGW